MVDASAGSSRRADNLKGIALLTLGMALVVTLDSLVKYAGTFTHPTWVSAMLGLAIFLGCIGPILRSGKPLFSREALMPIVLLRSVGDAGGAFLIILSLSLVSLTLVTVIMQTLPLMITLGAVVFLRERATLSQWVALLTGFCGALLIVQPGAQGFELGAVVSVLAAIGFATRDLASRAAPKSVTTFQLSAWGALVFVALGVGLSLVQGHPPPPLDRRTFLILLALAVFGTSAQVTITAAMRIGDVGVVAPFRYTRLVFGVAFGMALFGDQLDLLTVVGSLIIVGSGLFVWWSEQRRDR